MTLLLTLMACSVDAELVELDVDGVERSYYLHVPEGLPAGAPVILAFHGGGGKGDHTGRTMVRFTGLNELADERGFVAVYPSSLGGNWNDGRGVSSSDDLAYADALLDDVLARTGADPERVFTTGMSNGGFFSMALACQRADRLAGAAAVGSTQSADLACDPVRHLPVMLIAGTEDPLVPYGGGEVASDRGTALSAEATIEGWRERQGCAEEPATSDWPDAVDDGTSVHEERSCAGTPEEVRLLEVRGGGHTWPGGSQYLPRLIIGRVSEELDATDEIVGWFLDR
ncbi:MAG: dienelactone hydrolase family protein [Alphaproteobacteria bacterium]|nr:dienelactone hydrolase family protein [Alphaproteobacteria bacterium]